MNNEIADIKAYFASLDVDVDAIKAWTCRGTVRGCCGVKHRTIEAAVRCCSKDRASVSRLTGRCYSDRNVEPVEY